MRRGSPGEEKGGRRETRAPAPPESPARMPGGSWKSLAGGIGAREHDPQSPDWDKIRGETHLVLSLSFLPYRPSAPSSPPLNPPAFHGGPAGAQWEPKY